MAHGRDALARGDHGAALDAFRKAQAADPTDPDALLGLGQVLLAMGQVDVALRCLDKAHSLAPARWDIARQLVHVLTEHNRAADAQERLARVLDAAPDCVEALYASLTALPMVYQSEAELGLWRRFYRDALSRLEAAEATFTDDLRRRLIRAFGESGNFLISYQAGGPEELLDAEDPGRGTRDREEQTRFAAIVTRTASTVFEPFEDRRPESRPRPRVGFLSSNFRQHTVCRLFRGFVTERTPGCADVYVYQLGSSPVTDPFTAELAAAADQFRPLPFDFQAVLDAVRGDALDLLVFADIGMLGMAQVLAAARLAPHQGVLWGHPVTTGLASMDTFITSDAMEPEDNSTHYVESLLRLPGIGIHYRRPALPKPMDRSRLGVPGDAPLYLCVQSLFKYLPRYDALLARIAAAVPTARFAFLGHPRAAVTAAFSKRLGAEFARHGVVFDARAVFLPRLSHSDYLAVNLAADVFLDTPEWSGGNTTLEAIACGLPVVTLPGTFMRGRHSAAILEQLGAGENVASSEDDYVAIASMLGLDPSRRSRARAHVEVHADSTVFEQRTAVQSFESWVISKKSSPT